MLEGSALQREEPPQLMEEKLKSQSSKEVKAHVQVTPTGMHIKAVTKVIFSPSHLHLYKLRSFGFRQLHSVVTVNPVVENISSEGVHVAVAGLQSSLCKMRESMFINPYSYMFFSHVNCKELVKV